MPRTVNGKNKAMPKALIRTATRASRPAERRNSISVTFHVGMSHDQICEYGWGKC